MQSLTFIMFTVSEKIETLMFLPHTDTRPAGLPNTDHYTGSLKKIKKKLCEFKKKEKKDDDRRHAY